jgi:hypothetical protein
MLSIIFPLVLLSILMTMIIISLGYQYTAKLFPLLVMLPVTALLAAQIFISIRAGKKQKAAPEGDKRADQASLGDYLKSQVWVVALLLAIYLLGFVAGPALFLLIYLKTHGVKWLTTTICVSAIIAIVYGAFGLIFEVYLYPGLLFS